jgi:AcrR family transcriptional regulator
VLSGYDLVVDSLGGANLEKSLTVLKPGGLARAGAPSGAQRSERVARYGKEHKQATGQRIIETAGRRFKRDGIDGSGISTLMADAGLANGAFYAHFASKDDLVATAVADQLRVQYANVVEQAAPGGIDHYGRPVRLTPGAEFVEQRPGAVCATPLPRPTR